MSGMNRQLTKTGILSAGILLVALLLGIANYFGWKYHGRFDWTTTKLYSLSEQTDKVLAGLDRDVDVAVLLSPEQQQSLYGPTRELLDRYAAASRHLKVRYVDPEKNPVEAQQLARKYQLSNASVILSVGADKKIVDAGDLAEFDYSSMGMGAPPKMSAFKGEQMFTNALIQLGQAKKSKILFTSGHGEASLDSAEGRGLSGLRELLAGDGFDVEEWASLGKAAVPDDTDLLVIAGPTANFVQPELDAIGAYLDRGAHGAGHGGRLLVFLDPVLAHTGSGLVATGLEGLLAKYGIKVDDDIVVDPSNPLPSFGAETLFSNSYGNHPIVEPLARQNLPLLVSLARSVRAETGPAGAGVTELARTTGQGWGETNLAALDKVGKDDKDVAGPVGLAVAVGGPIKPPPPPEDSEAPPPPAAPDDPKKPRLVVFGDSDLATNQYWNASVGNSTLIGNAVNWLVERKDLIAIAPKKTEQARLTLTAAQLRNVYLLVLGLLPGAAIALAVWVRIRRRRREA
ncbi:MAG TPA: GldG family protein [Thermoanaerobaculia bacterium]|nr:GldG family protein [Thermoanaerobaculia bacterium]